MQIPFTSEQFFSVFARYNTAVWPMQWVLGLLAVVAVSLALWKGSAGPSIAIILAIFWLWMGIAYHWAFFAAINPAAKLFGSLFVIQGSLFLFAGTWRNMLKFERPKGVRGIVGLILIIYAIVIYPLLGSTFGHHYPAAHIWSAMPHYHLHPGTAFMDGPYRAMVAADHPMALGGHRHTGGDKAGCYTGLWSRAGRHCFDPNDVNSSQGS